MSCLLLAGMDGYLTLFLFSYMLASYLYVNKDPDACVFCIAQEIRQAYDAFLCISTVTEHLRNVTGWAVN